MSALHNQDNEDQLDFPIKKDCEADDNDENKTTNSKRNEKPLNFLAKIASGCHRRTAQSDKWKDNSFKGNSKYIDMFIDESKVFSTDNLDDTDTDDTDPSYLLAKICSSKNSDDGATKMQLLASLANTCMQRPELYETIGSSPLVYYAEGLLFTYTEALYMRTNCRQGLIIPGPSISELILLIPVLKFLIPAANMAVQKIRAIFLYQSEVLPQLMRASTQCSYNAISTLNKLRAAVSYKVLAGAVLEMSHLDTLALFAKCFGINASSLDLKLLGYHATLYDTSGANEININLDFIQKRPPSGKKYTQSLADVPKSDPILDCCEDIDAANWSDIIVARVLLLRVVLVYKEDGWREHLAYINSQVQEHVRMDDPLLQKPEIGAVYGFWSADATFEGEALLMMQCLRGQVLTLTGDWAMFWAIDVGLLGYIPKAKLCSLPEHVASQAPLISICLLRGAVCDMDELFLESAYQLLRIILETNAQTGKHMLLCESGEHILSLFEYPEAAIRIAFLDLLLCLAKNSKDVAKFLMKHHFDMTLLGKLERFGHIYTAGLCSCEESMEKEISHMVMILQTILDQKEDVRNWSENRRISRVLWMFLCNKKCMWKQLMEKCLFSLSGKSTQAPYIRRGGFRNQQTYRHDWGNGHERRRGNYHDNGRSERTKRNWDRTRFNGRGGYGCGEGGWVRDDKYSEQKYRNTSHFIFQEPSFQKRSKQLGHETLKSCSSSELKNNQETDPKSPKESVEIQTNSKPEREKTETFHKQWKESGDYLTNYKHNFVGNWKSDSEGWQKYGFHTDGKTDLVAAEDRWLMSGRGGNDKARMYIGQSRPITSRLSKFNMLKSPTSAPNRVTATYHDLLSSCDDPPSAVDNIEPVVKQMGEVSLESETDYVIRGTKATVNPDKTHELVLEMKLWEIKEVVLAQKLCGLLNNNVEGSMIFGLSADSTVEGVRLGRGDKDVFRNGIDRIMNRCLIPEVRANSYDIVFTPVLKQDEKTVDLTQHWLYIIEIRVRPMVHMVYMVYQGHKCFMRRETETVECTAQQKKQDMMDAEDRALEESIEGMGVAALSDLASLAEFVNKYLPQSNKSEY